MTTLLSAPQVKTARENRFYDLSVSDAEYPPMGISINAREALKESSNYRRADDSPWANFEGKVGNNSFEVRFVPLHGIISIEADKDSIDAAEQKVQRTLEIRAYTPIKLNRLR